MQAVMHDEPAPVFSCWNGIAAFRADPFIPVNYRSNRTLSHQPSPPLPSTHPLYPLPSNQTPATAPPLQFRTSAPAECFSSECFLLPYDFRRVFALNKIYVNPRVINAYKMQYYFLFKYVVRHWLVKYWIEHVEKGDGMHRSVLMFGDRDKVETWDGGDCLAW